MDEMTLNVRTAAVRAEGLSRRYGATRALDDVSLTLDRGITGLLGPNGAGKTTLLSILATVNEPDAGQVSGFGLDPRDAAGAPGVRRAAGLPAPGAGLPPALHRRGVPGLRGDLEGDHRPPPPRRGDRPGAGRPRAGTPRPHPDTRIVRRAAAAPGDRPGPARPPGPAD